MGTAPCPLLQLFQLQSFTGRDIFEHLWGQDALLWPQRPPTPCQDRGRQRRGAGALDSSIFAGERGADLRQAAELVFISQIGTGSPYLAERRWEDSLACAELWGRQNTPSTALQQRGHCSLTEGSIQGAQPGQRGWSRDPSRSLTGSGWDQGCSHKGRRPRGCDRAGRQADKAKPRAQARKKEANLAPRTAARRVAHGWEGPC